MHNKTMLKTLNQPITRSYAAQRKEFQANKLEDDQLAAKILLCVRQRVILTNNLWVEARLVNGFLGTIRALIYAPTSKPPELPSFVVVDFLHYKGPPWDPSNPKFVPIPPITRVSQTQIPLRMAWALTIHKSQGMTLDKATIDIGNIDRQGLTFTAVSRVRSLNDLCISPAFSFSRYSRMKENHFIIRRKKEESLLASKSIAQAPSSPSTIGTLPSR